MRNMLCHPCTNYSGLLLFAGISDLGCSVRDQPLREFGSKPKLLAGQGKGCCGVASQGQGQVAGFAPEITAGRLMAGTMVAVWQCRLHTPWSKRPMACASTGSGMEPGGGAIRVPACQQVTDWLMCAYARMCAWACNFLLTSMCMCAFAFAFMLQCMHAYLACACVCVCACSVRSNTY